MFSINGEAHIFYQDLYTYFCVCFSLCVCACMCAYVWLSYKDFSYITKTSLDSCTLNQWVHSCTTWWVLPNEKAWTSPGRSYTLLTSAVRCYASLQIDMFFWRVVKMVSLRNERCINLKFLVKPNKTAADIISNANWSLQGGMHVTCLCAWVAQDILRRTRDEAGR